MHAEQITPTDPPFTAPVGPDAEFLRLLLARDADADADADADPPDADAMRQARPALAALVIGASLGLGAVADLFFYGSRVGINLLLFVLLVLGVGFALLARTGRRTYAVHLAFIVPALLGAALLSVRAAPLLTTLNFALLAGSLFVVMRFVSEPRFLGGDWLVPVFSAFQLAIAGWIEGPLRVLLDGGEYLRRFELEQAQVQRLMPVLRGLVLTIPVLVVFGLLLGSADMLFQDWLARGLGWLRPADPLTVTTHLALIGAVTWGCLTGFKWLLFGPLETSDFTARRTTPAPARPWLRLSMVETSMVLGSVNALFLVFMLVQARYLFGGAANITAQGYTYADYARRGFWELLTVSCLTMVLALVLDAWTVRKRAQEATFRWLVTALVGLTLLLLAAAYYRLDLYERAYGFTRIRVMSGVFMGWLGALLVVLLVCVWAQRRGWFWPGAAAVMTGFVLTLNAVNLDSFIARQNIARFEEGASLDVSYLLSLSHDAVPALVPLLDHADLSDVQRDALRRGLGQNLWELDQDRAARHALGYHVGRAQAWRALDARRDVLAEFVRPPAGYGYWSVPRQP